MTHRRTNAAEQLRDLIARDRPGQGTEPDFAADVPQVLRSVSATVARHRTGGHRPRHSRHQARARLEVLLLRSLAGPEARASLARFCDEQEGPFRPTTTRGQGEVGEVDIDAQIEGARTFGCFLHLVGHPHSALFWWKFAAGAGDQTSAFCIYLHLLLRGEESEASWWLDQAVAVHSRGASPAPTLPDIDGWCRILPTLLPAPAYASITSRPLLPYAGLAPEVDRLVVRQPQPYVRELEEIDDYLEGVAGRPGPSFTRTLESTLT